MPEGGVSPDALLLLDAVTAMSSDLDLHNVLDRIVQSACALTGARYGALGIIGRDGMLADFLTHGLSDHARARIGDLPRGRGILGLLIDHPEPLRLPHLEEHPAATGFPAHHPPMTSFLGVPVRIRGTVFGNLYLCEKEGGPFTEQDEQLVDALATAAGFVIENARSYALSERQRSWLETVARLNESLAPGVPVEEALRQVAIAARLVSRARALGIVRPEEPAVLVTVDGREADQLPALLQQYAAGWDPAPREPLDLGDGRALVVVPVEARVFGRVLLVALTHAADRDAALAEHEDELLSAFADQAALALDRLQALEDHELLAVISDRDRIARDLHDVVIQRLFATGLQLQGVRGRVTSEEVGARIDGAVGDLDTTIREIRSAIFALQSSAADSLRTTLAGLVGEYTAVLGFRPELRIEGPVDTVVPADLAEQVVAVAREGLSNAARHAGARWVGLTAVATAHAVEVRVEDDGAGPGTGTRQSGLANVRRRAEERGGRAGLAPRSPAGSVLTWSVPLP